MTLAEATKVYAAEAAYLEELQKAKIQITVRGAGYPISRLAAAKQALTAAETAPAATPLKVV